MRNPLGWLLLSVCAATALFASPAGAQLQVVPDDSTADSTADKKPEEPPPSTHSGRHRGLREVNSSREPGWWLGIGVGAGSESYVVPSNGLGYTNSLVKPTLSLRIGGTLSPHFRLGGEVFAWLNQEGDMMESVSTYMVVGQWYPSRREGLYLKGGVGLGRYGQDFNYSSFSDLGFAGNLGLGYEFRVGRKVSLGPIFDVYQATFHGRSYPSYRERVLNLGVSVLISEH